MTDSLFGNFSQSGKQKRSQGELFIRGEGCVRPAENRTSLCNEADYFLALRAIRVASSRSSLRR